jgi:putative (di)nucleoside polyphosphate hydrolase
MLISTDRRIFVGRRAGMAEGMAWQMPQGGVDKGETPLEAACRELGEEVGTSKALYLRETGGWITYDVPEDLRPKHWKNRWTGQAQKWFALAFTGTDRDIDLDAHANAPGGDPHGPEFVEWQWMTAAEMMQRIVAFKRPVYESVLKEFADLVT